MAVLCYSVCFSLFLHACPVAVNGGGGGLHSSAICWSLNHLKWQRGAIRTSNSSLLPVNCSLLCLWLAGSTLSPQWRVFYTMHRSAWLVVLAIQLQKSIKCCYMFCFTREMITLTLIKQQNSRKCSLLTCLICRLGPIRLGIVHVIRFFSVNRYNIFTTRYENV